MAKIGDRIDGWVVVRAAPTKDERDRDIPLARRAPDRVEYRGVRGLMAAGSVRLEWPGHDLDGMVFTPDKAALLVDYYLAQEAGEPIRWPFSWLKIIPPCERGKNMAPVRTAPALFRPEDAPAPREAAPEVRRPLEGISPEVARAMLHVVEPAAPEPPKARKLTKKQQRQAMNIQRDEDGRLIF